MSKMQSRRRQEAQESLGLLQKRQVLIDELAIADEEHRREVKLKKRQQIEKSRTYSLVKGIATVMDKYFVDTIIGLILPVVGDLINSIFVLPYIYVSYSQIKSIPLTLAVIYNSLIDILLGIIPGLGDITDFFHRSYIKNWRLIVGFVEDDRKVINEVNKKAILMGFLIVVVILLIFLLCKLISGLISGLITVIGGFFSRLF